MWLFGQVWFACLVGFVVGVLLDWVVRVRPLNRRVAELEARASSAGPAQPTRRAVGTGAGADEFVGPDADADQSGYAHAEFAGGLDTFLTGAQRDHDPRQEYDSRQEYGTSVFGADAAVPAEPASGVEDFPGVARLTENWATHDEPVAAPVEPWRPEPPADIWNTDQPAAPADEWRAEPARTELLRPEPMAEPAEATTILSVPPASQDEADQQYLEFLRSGSPAEQSAEHEPADTAAERGALVLGDAYAEEQPYAEPYAEQRPYAEQEPYAEPYREPQPYQDEPEVAEATGIIDLSEFADYHEPTREVHPVEPHQPADVVDEVSATEVTSEMPVLNTAFDPHAEAQDEPEAAASNGYGAYEGYQAYGDYQPGAEEYGQPADAYQHNGTHVDTEDYPGHQADYHVDEPQQSESPLPQRRVPGATHFAPFDNGFQGNETELVDPTRQRGGELTPIGEDTFLPFTKADAYVDGDRGDDAPPSPPLGKRPPFARPKPVNGDGDGTGAEGSTWFDLAKPAEPADNGGRTQRMTPVAEPRFDNFANPAFRAVGEIDESDDGPARSLFEPVIPPDQSEEYPPARPDRQPPRPVRVRTGVDAPPTPATVIPPADGGAGPFGPGSALPLPDGSAPSDEFRVKARTSSMVFHTESSPFYERLEPQVWFRDAQDAQRAGFTSWERPRTW